MATGTIEPRTVPPPPPAAVESVERERLIRRQLARTGWHVRLVDLGSALVVWVIGLLLLFLLAAAADHLVGLGTVGRCIGLSAIVAFSLWYLTMHVGPLLVRAINPAYAARTIEEATPTLKNSLINFLLLRQERGGLKEIVYQAVERQAAADIADVPVEATVDRTRLIHAGYALCAVMTFFAAYKILSPKDPFQTIARVIAPWAEIARPSRVQISEVDPGSTEVYYGQSVKIEATVRGVRDGDKINVLFSTADGQTIDQSIPMKLSAGNRYECNLPPEPASPSAASGLLQNVTYRVVAGDAETFPYRLNVVAAPTIIVDRLEFQYPAYTRKAAESARQQGDIKAIEGTKITIHTIANQPIKSAFIELDPETKGGVGETVPLIADGQNARGTITLQLRPDRQTPWRTTYQVRFLNERGQRSQQPILHRIEVLRDLAPEVQILKPESPRVSVPEDGEQTIEVRAVDPDFGLAKLFIEGTVPGKEPLSIDLLEDAAKQPPQVVVPYAFHPREHQLKAGDELRFAAAAEDNRTNPLTGQPEPNVTRTREYTLVVTEARKADQGKSGQNQQPGGAGQKGKKPDEKTQPKNDDQKSKSRAQKNSQKKDETKQPDQKNSQSSGDKGDQGSGSQSKDGQEKEGNKPDGQQSKKGQSQPKNGDQQNKQEPDKQEPGDQQSGDNKQKSGDQQKSGEQKTGQQGDQQQKGQQQKGEQQSGQQQKGQQQGNEQQGDQQQNQQGDQQQGGKGSQGGQAGQGSQGNDQAGQNEPGESSGSGGQKGQSSGKSGKSGQQQTGEQKNDGGGEPNGEPAGSEPTGGKAQHDGQAIERIWKELQQRGQDSQPAGKNSPDQGQNSEGNSQQPGNQSDSQPGGKSQKSGSSGAKGQNTPNPGTPEGNDQQLDPSVKGSKSQGNSGKSDKTGDRVDDQKKGQSPSEQQSGSNKGGESQGASKTDKGEKSSASKDGTKGEQRDSGAGKTGDEGAGQASQDKTGSGDGNFQNRDKKKEQEEGGNKPGESEPSPANSSNKQSDSKGGTSGENSGGGKQGAGQAGAQEGNDSAGGKSAGDQGAGKAQETGSGETGSKAGQQQPAAGKTGKSGTEKGEGSSSRDNEGAQTPGEGTTQPKAGGQPGNSPTANKSGQPNDKQTNDGKSSDENPAGGASGNSEPSPPKPPTAEDQAADAANLEYARKATEMVLRRLKDEQHNPDPELLDKLGWTREDLAEFLRRWENLEKSATETPTGKRELDEALKSLGLRDPANRRRAGGKTSDNQRDLRDAGNRSAAPPKYREMFDAFRKGAARSAP